MHGGQIVLKLKRVGCIVKRASGYYKKYIRIVSKLLLFTHDVYIDNNDKGSVFRIRNFLTSDTNEVSFFE